MYLIKGKNKGDLYFTPLGIFRELRAKFAIPEWKYICRYTAAPFSMRCTENPIYLFPEEKLPGLSPHYYIHVSVSDFYIPRIGPHICLQQNRQTDPENISISHRFMGLRIGRQNIIILVWK
jgi:hypothetical protein